MFDLEVKMEPGNINVQTTSERGHTSEELAANAVAKIINIADSADPQEFGRRRPDQILC